MEKTMPRTRRLRITTAHILLFFKTVGDLTKEFIGVSDGFSVRRRGSNLGCFSLPFGDSDNNGSKRVIHAILFPAHGKASLADPF
jgi:hypothetical protein